MSRRITAMVAALTLLAFAGAQADEMSGEGFGVPKQSKTVSQREEPVSAAPPPWVTIETTSIGAGIAVSWGSGTLSFEGQEHAFSVSSVGLLDVGVARLVATGDVRNLEQISDFEGRYLAVEAGAAAGVGASTVALRNENGVVITLRTEEQGVRLALGAGSVSISLE